MFKLKSNFELTGDQPKATKKLIAGINAGEKNQVLLGVTGSGKTFTIANVIKSIGRPTLIISPNKTLAAQLYQEFKDFFPENSVHYFVSFYDYYQPEAYIPHSNTYIEKDSRINDEIDRLRHSATQAIVDRDDVIIIASVSCIYNLGSPEDYTGLSLSIFKGQRITQEEIRESLKKLQYGEDIELKRGVYRKTYNEFEIASSTGNKITKIKIKDDKIENILVADQINIDDVIFELPKYKKVVETNIYPAKYWVAKDDKAGIAIENIRAELQKHLIFLQREGLINEAARLEERTELDLEMIRQTGYCHGIENYSRHLDFRKPGHPPYTLIDFFRTKEDFLTIIDESHITIPQIRGMHSGDFSRKTTLVNHGFRLPSAIDNRPLKFPEFEKLINQTIFVSATPGAYELKKVSKKKIAEQIIRPTGLTDPTIEIKETDNQIGHLIEEIKKRKEKNQRVLATTITKRMAEDLTEYLSENNIQVNYIHSDVKTLDRVEILNDLRKGAYDVIVGVNLLREGLDLPEVSLIAILDADKEGFLRNTTTLIQTMGRAARNIDGHIIMYADKVTKSMKLAIDETNRRRKIQEDYNLKNNITPSTIIKNISKNNLSNKKSAEEMLEESSRLRKSMSPEEKLSNIQKEMGKAIKDLRFDQAMKLREKYNDMRHKIETAD